MTVLSPLRTPTADPTPQSEERHNAQVACELCHKAVNRSDKVRHHRHDIETDNYVATLCSKCNLLLKNKKTVLTVIAHNASYDLGILLREGVTSERISILPRQSRLKFHRVRIGNLSFILSVEQSLVTNTYIELGGELKYTNAILREYSDKTRSLLTRGKQLLPYDYLTSLSVLDEERLPPREAFYNSLKEQGIIQNDYSTAKRYGAHASVER